VCTQETRIPPAWRDLDVDSLDGVILVIGAPDTGKSTFARYLYQRLHRLHTCVALIDGDMGQATLGPPTTMTLTVDRQGSDETVEPARASSSVHRVFVGSVSPRRHMLPTVVGASKLVERARSERAAAIVFDTTGLIDPACGGGELKRAKIALLQPAAVVGIQRQDELEHLLAPLQRAERTRVIELPTPAAARRRHAAERREHRARQFRRYFAEAYSLEITWSQLAVFPTPAFAQHQLVALEDRQGFALGLGIILSDDPDRATITVHTPLPSLDGVNSVTLGDMAVDPHTFRETCP
jgi:polynucleotide 5'-hydroxyl-kinase GRC3/NOL9